MARLWAVSDGRTGHESLALGVAETLGLKPEIKRVRTDGFWAALAPFGPPPPGSVGSEGAAFAPPWPSIVIGVGRCSMPYLTAIKKASGGASFVMALQNPVISPKNFDLVWAPAHDRLEGENVITSITGPHRLSAQAVAAAGVDYAKQLAGFPQQKVAVLVGGPTPAYRFGEMEARLLCAQLDQLGQDIGFLITTSRRTPKEVSDAIKAWARNRKAKFWSGEEGPNPYLGYLGAADAIVVTSDSANMLGEAASTGKPIYIFQAPEKDLKRSEKFVRLQEAIQAAGAARRLVGKLETWSYEPLDANKFIASALRARLVDRGVILPANA
jgi:hypothetical protein